MQSLIGRASEDPCPRRADGLHVRGSQFTTKKASRTTARCGKRARSEVHATTVLSRAKKDTLQALCEDINIPVTGNKDELMYRIIAAITDEA